jgi:cation transport ATPase
MWRGVDRFWGAFALLRFWRPEAKNTVAAMREMGTKTFLLGRDPQNVTTMGGENAVWMKPSESGCPIRKHSG